MSTCKFFRAHKLHLPYRLMQFRCLWKIYLCLLTPNCSRNHVITNTDCDDVVITQLWIFFSFNIYFGNNGDPNNTPYINNIQAWLWQKPFLFQFALTWVQDHHQRSNTWCSCRDSVELHCLHARWSYPKSQLG